MTDVERVLVVGGGIAGLTVAMALRGRRFQVELVERAEDWQAVGAGISVQANGMRILRRLGLDRAVIDAGCIFRRWVFADQDGAALCEIDL
ncbi:MAG: FAD-dependent oxidoreductase, partial [Actinobacteria bacterium]|nr:FAD-dependent oxidoreductase [Actinomycetota bacterium]